MFRQARKPEQERIHDPGNGEIDGEAFVNSLIAARGTTRRALVPILQEVQKRYHYLPEAVLRSISEKTELTPADIAGVSTFFSQFRHRPAGAHRIKVCVGTACHIKGADRVFDAFKSHLGIPEEEDTDAEHLFTVEKVACIGCCMLAPAIQIDDLKYGFLNRDKVPLVLADFLKSQVQGPGIKTPSKRSRGGRETMGEIRLCVCSSCSAAGATKVYEELKHRVDSLGLPAGVKTVGCTGVSYEAPLVEVVPAGGAGFRYGRVGPAQVPGILARHFKPRAIGKRLAAAGYRMLEKLLTDEAWEPVTRYSVDPAGGADSLFWGTQRHIVTEHCGTLDPLDLESYREHRGFAALETCLHLSPDEIVGRIRSSGLRGRGGAGYGTARKWESVRTADSDGLHAPVPSSPASRKRQKFIVCNGDEGDPGAFMDRMILESFPFRVIEGMAIAALAVGAERGFLYVREEYPLAIERLGAAIALCRQRGILGEDLLGSGKPLELEVVRGAGAFVAGEETALMAAIEGRRAVPRYRPPYPSDRGLWGRPTLINNVETFANVPWIMRNGPEAFAALGTPDSRGTKTFALAGKVNRGGLIEVPMGLTIRQVVEEIGGGIQDGFELKAIQVGGPSGGCVPAALADTPIDYEALKGAGAIMGSGGMVVLDQRDCMVDLARYFMTFTQNESCGKCTCCRIGTRGMLDILERLCRGEAGLAEIDRLAELARIVQRGSLCGLGRTAPNPVLSTLKHFKNEYEAHARGSCPAGKCKALIAYEISDSCIGCTRCAQRCPVEAISGEAYEKHVIDPDKCVRCGTCRDVCPTDSVRVR
jgi:NADH-quinone oxidoreductase subunit F